MVKGLIGETIDEEVDGGVEGEEEVCQIHWNDLPEWEDTGKIHIPDFTSSFQKVRQTLKCLSYLQQCFQTFF